MLDIIKSIIRPKPPIVIIHSGTNVISGMNTMNKSQENSSGDQEC